MRRSRWVRLAALGLLLGSACSTSSDLGLGIYDGSVSGVTAEALDLHTVRLRWQAGGSTAKVNILRRKDLTGPFQVIASSLGRNVTEYLDTGLDPASRYGYRIEAFDPSGASLGASTTAAADTPPLPGIDVQTVTDAPPGAADADGYALTIAGPRDTTVATLAASGTRRFSPLATGRYRLTLGGLAANCLTQDSLQRTLDVTDQGVQTIRQAVFSVACSDPSRGDIALTLSASGDLVPATVTVRLLGITDSLQAVELTRNTPPTGVQRFSALRPGNYQVRLENLPANCTAAPGAVLDDVIVKAQESTNRAIALTCTDPDAANKPFILVNTFSPASAAPGAVVSLTVQLDLRAQPDKRANTAQATIRFDPAVLQYDSAQAGGLATVFAVGTANVADGILIPGGVRAGLGLPNLVTLTRLWFTVKAGVPNGATFTTASSDIKVTVNTQADPATSVDVSGQFRRTEGTFTVGTSGGGGANQAPTARPGGPYSGTAGSPISFSGAASSDPDGTIVSYQWSFGNGATATGATPSYAYPSAVGSPFTVTLTVTDDKGATASATTSATIGATSGNQAPTARPGGPYSGTVGAPIAFNGSASSDPDGSIAGYAWTFGDGGTASGASPTHAYASPGTYTATLTVTDNLGAQSTASATVTVASGGSAQPLVWTGTFSAVTATRVQLTITYDLTTDLSQTPGIEALGAWGVTQLKWDPAVLRFVSLSVDSGLPGGFNFTNANQGSISFSGDVAAARSTGVVPIARVVFDVIGASGSSTTTQTTLGQLQGTADTGFFGYNPYTRVVEGTYTVP